MNKSKKQTWFWLILILIILIALYFVFDKFSKEGMDLEQSCINNNGEKECVSTANKCESLPDGSYNCTKNNKNNKKQKQE
jgi:hypothetical protein